MNAIARLLYLRLHVYYTYIEINNNKDKDFIKRFFDTESIDYNGIPATHLLSYATTDNGAIVYPVV